MLAVWSPAALADEGMWLFNAPPGQLLKEKYGFDVSNKWLDHLQKSSVRFNSGGSGSFVSADGLVMTNHHVGLDALHQISTPSKDYVKDGFYAATRDQEVKAEHAELNVLMSMEDVTERINAAIKPGLPPDKAALARRAIMSEIEKESKQKTGLQSEVVTLYQGGRYHLYRYKKYTDVRLVFAPEQQIAFFGGDPDNFEYPRFDLDICFFRVYENGQPARIDNYLKWSKAGAGEGELVFVSGHPGRTERLNTMAELKYQRDRILPFTLQLLYNFEVAYSVFSGRSAENARRAKEDLFGVQNSRKARLGTLGGLLDPALIGQKQAAEQKLRNQVMANSSGPASADPWVQIEEAQKVLGQHALTFNMLEAGRGFSCTLFGIARTLLRAAEERPKPNAQRLREFRDSALESLEEGLFSKAPIYEDFEIVKLTNSLTLLANQLGADSDLVRKVLAGKSPQERAAALVKGTKVKDVAVRQKLYKGGKAAVAASQDPMIELARLIDPRARAVRRTVETQGEIKQQAHARIGRARFAVEGTSVYPDATFTLRLAFGTVKGYEENGKARPNTGTRRPSICPRAGWPERISWISTHP
jgi:hypothetical protein